MQVIVDYVTHKIKVNERADIPMDKDVDNRYDQEVELYSTVSIYVIENS